MRHWIFAKEKNGVRRFKKESLGPGEDANLQAQKNMNSTTEMKITLVKNDEEERSKGRVFMKRVEERWDLEFLEQASVSIDNLRSNASHFEKGPNKEFNLSGK